MSRARRGRRRTAEGETKPGARRMRRRLGALAALAVAVLVGVVGYEWATWPDVARLATEPPDTTAFMRRYLERRADRPELPPLRWSWAPLSETSVHVQRAVVSAEDMEFFQHAGFSTSEIRAALREAFRGEDLRGASTITQQLAKNLWLTPSRNPLRKVREAILTWQLEKRLGKSRILEIYLNVVELGPGLYGVEAASRHYFGIPAADLGERRAAMLAASLPRPTSWHPGVDSRAYARYVDDVLRRMDRADFLWRFVRGQTPVEVIPEPTPPRLTDALPVPDTSVADSMSALPHPDTLPRDTLGARSPG